MTTIRKFVYAALLAAAAINLAPTVALAQEPARGKFKLAHDVLWGNASVRAGEYEFSYDPYQLSPVLTLTRIDGTHASFMVLVLTSDESKPSASNQIVLASSAGTSYVKAMELAECGMTLHFMPPSHPVKQVANAIATIASSGK